MPLLPCWQCRGGTACERLCKRCVVVLPSESVQVGCRDETGRERVCEVESRMTCWAAGDGVRGGGSVGVRPQAVGLARDHCAGICSRFPPLLLHISLSDHWARLCLGHACVQLLLCLSSSFRSARTVKHRRTLRAHSEYV